MRPKDLEMDRLIQQLIILLSEKSHSLIIHRQHSVNCTFWRMFASPFFTQAVLSQTEPQGRTVAGENGGRGECLASSQHFPEFTTHGEKARKMIFMIQLKIIWSRFNEKTLGNFMNPGSIPVLPKCFSLLRYRDMGIIWLQI